MSFFKGLRKVSNTPRTPLCKLSRVEEKGAAVRIK